MRRKAIPTISLAIMLTILSGCLSITRRSSEPDWLIVTGYGVTDPNLPPSQGRLMARKAAIADAQRQLLEAVKGVQIDSRTRVVDFITRDDRIRSRVYGIIRGAETIGQEFHDDGTVSVRMRIDLNRVRDAIK